MKKSFSLVVVCLLAAGLTAPVLAQEDEGPITWLAFQTTKPGKTTEALALTVAHDGPMFDRLLSEGKISSWGVAIPINHNLTDTWNWVQWITTENWAGVGDLQGGFMQLFQSRREGEQDALNDAWKASVEEGSHFDWVVRHMVHEVNPEKALDARYFGISYMKALPGKGMELTGMYREKVRPIYEKLMADGTVAAFGLYVPELHSDPNVTHVAWYSFESLAAMDTIDAAFDAALTAEDWGKFVTMVDFEKHWDQVLMIIHMGGREEER